MKIEDNLQIACATYLRLQFPELLWAHIANERHTSPARGRKLKLMGVRAGMPDILIFDWMLAVELKTSAGRLTETQKEILAWLARLGWSCAVCRSFDDFRSVIISAARAQCEQKQCNGHAKNQLPQ